MITIDRIGLDKEHRYHFPTIDFKFQNRGSATAFLWQFRVEVLRMEIDGTPILDFYASLEGNTLLIKVRNNGWGPARNCDIKLEEPLLGQLFSESACRYKGNIESGSDQEIFRFSKVMADPKQLKIVEREFKEMPPDGFARLLGNSVTKHGLVLPNISVRWSCNDARYKGQAKVPFQDERFRGPIILTKIGFEGRSEKITIRDPHPYLKISDTTYGVLLDSLKGSYEQEYPISREIPSGDVERFHIMIGAPMSCHLQARFKFFIDQDPITVIESEIFDISIWNPRNTAWHYDYTDDKRKVGRVSNESIFPLTSKKSSSES